MLRCGYKRFCVAIGRTEMLTDMRLIRHYAGNKMDFTRGNFQAQICKLDSASSILQICWLPLCNPSKLEVSNSQNPPKTAGAFTWKVATLLHNISQSYNAVHYVVINKVDANFVVFARPFRFFVHNTPSWSGLFLSKWLQFLERGKFFQ